MRGHTNSTLNRLITQVPWGIEQIALALGMHDRSIKRWTTEGISSKLHAEVLLQVWDGYVKAKDAAQEEEFKAALFGCVTAKQLLGFLSRTYQPICSAVGRREDDPKVFRAVNPAYRCPRPARGSRIRKEFVGKVLDFAPDDDACKFCGNCGEHIDAHGRAASGGAESDRHVLGL